MKELSSSNGTNGVTSHSASEEKTNGGRRQPHPSGSASKKVIRTEAFDQPVILQQTSLWSRAIVWTIVGVTTFGVAWASLAKIEEAIPATGKLEPQGRVQEIQAPVGGVIQEIYVEDGQRVEQGDLLVRLDSTAALAQQQSLEEIRQSLQQENRFYRAQLLGVPLSGPEAVALDVPPEMLSLTANRIALVSENQLYLSQLQGGDGANLSPAQRARLRAIQVEADSRANAAQLEVSQVERQLNEVEIQLAAGRENLQINQQILADVTPLVEEGGLARLQYVRQQQEVLNSRSEVDRLIQEQARLQLAIAQAQQQLQNTVAVSSTDMLNRIAENDKRIAEIDGQLNKAIVENDKRISELESQLSQTELNLQYQELRAPVGGIVFDLQAQMQGVVGNTNEPVLKIVPGDSLIAKVFITNQDIGFVEPGMDVDVRIDSFPFSEFGDIHGTLERIGSDALPPSEIRPYYHFPADVRIDDQFLDVNGRELPLQSGMSISVNIKVRERSVISIFTDLFVRKVESLKTTR